VYKQIPVTTSRSSSIRDNLFNKLHTRSEEGDRLITGKAITAKHNKNYTLTNLSSNRDFNFLVNTTREVDTSCNKDQFIQNKYRTLINGFLK
jgi:hypothetical protein